MTHLQLPRQEWAVINQQALAEEQQRRRSERELQQSKRHRYKEFLDKAIQEKRVRQQMEKEEDKRYYKNLVEWQSEQQQKERQAKRKEIQNKKASFQYYQRELQSKKDMRLKTEQELKASRPAYFPFEEYSNCDKKKQLIPYYQYQIQRKERIKDYERELNKHLASQAVARDHQQDIKRQKQRHKIAHGYSQSQLVYEQYSNIHRQRDQQLAEENRRAQRLEHQKMREREAAQQQKRKANNKRAFQYQADILTQIQAKKDHADFLQQIKQKQKEEVQRLSQQYKLALTNRKSHSQLQYGIELDKQIQDKKMRNVMNKYMTEAEVRLNKPQLEKVISAKQMEPISSPEIGLPEMRQQRIIRRELGMGKEENRVSEYRPREQQFEHLYDRIRPLIKQK